MDRGSVVKHWYWDLDREGLAWLTFDKQGESANTFSREALEQLSAVLDEIAAGKPKGLIIRSAKDNFIAGADIQEFANFKSAEDALAFTRLGWDTFQKLHDLPFPTTAMVNGFCMGGGMEMALACRYRVALDDPRTRFAQPEVMVGVIPAWHAMEWLPQRVGRAHRPAPAEDPEGQESEARHRLHLHRRRAGRRHAGRIGIRRHAWTAAHSSGTGTGTSTPRGSPG